MAVLLRVRGNLTKSNGKWRLRWVPSEDAWQLAVSRDLIDSLMQKVALFSVLCVPGRELRVINELMFKST
jgi:hypothetical protein